MPITFNCPGCGKGYTVPDGVGGKSSKCRACGAAVKIPMSSQGMAAAPMAPVASMAPEPPARSGGGSGLKKIALVFVALLVVAGLGVLGYGAYALFGGSSSAGMTYMPNETQVLVSVRVADAMKSGVWAEVKKDNPDVDKKLTESLKDAPFQLEDIAQVLVGIGDFAKEEAVVAVEFKKSVKLQDVIDFLNKTQRSPKKFTETKIGSYTVLGDNEVSLCQINSNLIVGGQPAAVKAVLERDKKPTFSEGMQKAMKDADLSQTLAVAFNGKDLAKNPMVAGSAQQAGVSADSVESGAVNVSVSSDVRVNSVSNCKDAKAADEYRKMAEGGIVMAKKFAGDKMPKEVIEILDAVKIAAKDNRLTLDVQFKVGPLLPMVKGLMGTQAKQTFSTVGQEIGGPVGGKQ